MDYVIEKIDDGIAVLRYPDGSWAQVVLEKDMTSEQLDAWAWQLKPRVGVIPDELNLKEGEKRTASPLPQAIIPEWYSKRQNAYGNVNSQIEFITENGLEAWQEHVAEIKKMFPKTD